MKTLPEKVVAYIGAADVAMSKAAAIVSKDALTKQAMAERAPAVVDALIEHGHLHPHSKEAALAVVQDPVKLLDLLGKFAANSPKTAAAAPGVPAIGSPAPGTVKTASADPYAGRRTTGLKPSDIAFYQGLGVPLPTE